MILRNRFDGSVYYQYYNKDEVWQVYSYSREKNDMIKLFYNSQYRKRLRPVKGKERVRYEKGMPAGAVVGGFISKMANNNMYGIFLRKSLSREELKKAFENDMFDQKIMSGDLRRKPEGVRGINSQNYKFGTRLLKPYRVNVRNQNPSIGKSEKGILNIFMERSWYKGGVCVGIAKKASVEHKNIEKNLRDIYSTEDSLRIYHDSKYVYFYVRMRKYTDRWVK